MPEATDQQKETNRLLAYIAKQLASNERVQGSRLSTSTDFERLFSRSHEITTKKFDDLLEAVETETKKREEADKENLKRYDIQRAQDKRLEEAISNLTDLSQEQLDLARKNIKLDFEKRKLQEDINERERQILRRREDENWRIEKEFYDLGHKKDRNKKGFLQRMFESMRGGSGFFTSLTKATVGSAYDKYLKDSVDSLKTVANAMTGRVGTGTYDWARGQIEEKQKKLQEKRADEDFEETMSKDRLRLKEIERKQEDEQALKRHQLLFEEGKLLDRILERAKKSDPRIRTQVDVSDFDEDTSLDTRVDPRGLGGRVTNQEASSEDEAQLEAEEQYKEKTLKLSESGTDYLKEIASILKQVSDPTTHASFSVRAKIEGSVDAKGKPAEAAKGGGLLSSLMSMLSLGGIGSLLSKFLPTGMISKLFSKIPGASYLSKIPGIGRLFGGAGAEAAGTAAQAGGTAAKSGGILSRIGGALGKAGSFVGRGLGAAGKLAGRVAAPLAIATAGYEGVTGALDVSAGGFQKAQDWFGKKRHQLTTGERLSASTGGALGSVVTLGGLLGDKDVVGSKIAKGLHGAGSAVTDAGSWMKEKGGQGLSWMQENIPGLKTAGKFFQKEGLVGGAKKVGGELWDMGKDAVGSAKGWLDKTGISDKASSLWESTKETASGAGSWIADKAKGAASAVGSALGITDLLQELINLVKKLWGGYEAILKTTSQKAISAARSAAAMIPTGTQDNVQMAEAGRFEPAMTTVKT